MPPNIHESECRFTPGDQNPPNPPLRKGGRGDFHGKLEPNLAKYPETHSRLIGAVLLTAYAVFLVATNKYVTVFEDEATIIACAGNLSMSEFLSYLSIGRGLHEHPPLYDQILHLWLRMTNEEFAWLRIPSILFYCAALWLVGETAQILWKRRLLALLIGVAWPVGYFLGRPAHWSSLAMLGVAGSTWSYFWWKDSGRARRLVPFCIFSTALVYTNYFGWAFVGALCLDFILDRPKAREAKQFAIAVLITLVSFLPLMMPLFYEVRSGTHIQRPILAVVVNVAYYLYSVLVSESVAPWYGPALIAGLGIAGLVYSAQHAPGTFRLLGLLFLVYAAASLLGIMGGKRMGLLGPWLLLYLAGLIATGTKKKIAAVSLCLVFSVGWMGVITERWYASYRYTEPWPEVVSEAAVTSRPGDAIIAVHPSFYFYSRYALAWPEFYNACYFKEVIETPGPDFVPLQLWRDSASPYNRVTYVRSVVMPWNMQMDQDLMTYLNADYQLIGQRRFIPDQHSEIKRKFFPNQPDWRIELLTFEK